MGRGRGSSEPQLPSSNTRPGTAAPRGSAAGIQRRRRSSSSGSSSGGGSGAGFEAGRNMLRFYTDDAPGLKVSPTAVLVMSLFFIGFVTALHVFGKLYRKSTAFPGSASD